MAILLTGGTGKTSSRLGSLLHHATPKPISFLMASRRGTTQLPPDANLSSENTDPLIKFDWLDASTYSIPFQHTLPDPNEKITAVYLVAPDNAVDPAIHMNEFIDLAVTKYGVKRFVLLAGTTATKGGRHVGKVWERLDQLATEKGVNYCVLRATWFMKNFSEWQHFSALKNEGKIYSSCEDGKIPFVAAKDIAAVAFYALTAPRLERNTYRVRGLDLLSYDQVAEKFSKTLGREVTHIRLSLEENTKHLMEVGLAPGYANFLPMLEKASADGSEAELEDGTVEMATGHKAMSFDEWVLEHKHVWD